MANKKIATALSLEGTAVVDTQGIPLALEDVVLDAVSTQSLKDLSVDEIKDYYYLYLTLKGGVDLNASQKGLAIKAVAQVYEAEVVFSVIQALLNKAFRGEE